MRSSIQEHKAIVVWEDEDNDHKSSYSHMVLFIKAYIHGLISIFLYILFPPSLSHSRDKQNKGHIQDHRADGRWSQNSDMVAPKVLLTSKMIPPLLLITSSWGG